MMTLRRRLVVVNLIVFLVTLVVLISVISHQVLGHFYEQVDERLARTAADTAGEFTIRNGELHIAGVELPYGDDSEGLAFIRLLDGQGNVIQETNYNGVAPVRRSALRAGERGSAANARSETGNLLRVYTLPVNLSAADEGDGERGADRRYLQVAMAPEEVLEIARQVRNSLYMGVPLALVFAGVAGLLAARRALRPLVLMTRSAEDISADSLAEQRLPIPPAKDELQALALAFNATLDRLSTAFMRQRRFTADASHELRTPVAAILGQTELALSRTRTPAAYQEALVRILGEAERMQRMIGRLLSLARAESGQQVLEFAPTDVSALLRSLAESLTQTINGDEVRLELCVTPGAIATTDADSLTQVLMNLLENAISYTEQGVVTVSLKDSSDLVVIQISDEGPGITPQDLPLIFEQFYRADTSRQRKHSNVGLGLALAHELTRLLGGQIEAANRPTGGAIFTVTLPKRPSAAIV